MICEAQVKEIRNEVQKLSLQTEQLSGAVKLLALQIQHFHAQEASEREMLRVKLEARLPRE